MNTRKLLIVEDDESIRVLIKLLLLRLSFRLYEAKNGLEGLGMAKQYMPDLIIADLSMPVMNGITMMLKLKEDPVTKNIPVVVLTGTNDEQQRQAQNVGAVTVLSKPVSRRDLIDVIDGVLSK